MNWRRTVSRRLVGLAVLASLGVAPGWGRALAATTEELVRASADQPGVCVHLGRSDNPLVFQLAAGGRLLVQCLEADASKVAGVRMALSEQGLYGPVTVVPWAEAWLPYEDNLVNVLVVEDAAGVPESELMRVLVPNGVLWLRRGQEWAMQRKPWPADYDEWTHWRHGADGNMVSHDRAVTAPTGLRWVAGPAQDAGGKKWYYDHTMMSASGRNFYIYEDGITARDAFNGTRLWTRALKVYNFKETGTAVPEFLKPKIKVGTRTSKVKPVASANHLYVAAEGQLMALDAASGLTAEVYGEVSGPREVLVEGQVLVVCDTNAVRAYHLGTTKAMWETKLAAERMVAGEGAVFCLADSVIACLDLATGRERWRTINTNAIPATTCTYHDGVLVLEKSSWRNDEGGCGILVYSGKDGALLWQKDYKPAMTHFLEARTFIAGGLLWLETTNSHVTAYDLLTGAEKKSWKSGGHHCATPVATEHFFIAPECNFTDLETGKQARARMFKSACRLPFIPANGLLYSFPVQCECYPMLRGYMGLGAGNLAKTNAALRMVPGPAYGRSLVAAKAAPTMEWPMYRHDAWRSASTPTALQGTNLAVRWTTPVARPPAKAVAAEWKENPFVPGCITAPVVAGGQVLVAVPDEHRVAAWTADTGKPRWSFTAGGRIDTPPSLAEGLCLFGAHDGWIYCLTAERGELVWKFRAAPQETWIMAYGQMESLWPAPGSVLVENGIAYVPAGRHPMSDGGVRVLALNVRTGALVWEKQVTDLGLKSWYSPMLPGTQRKAGLDFEPVDLLVKDGESVAMSRWQFQPANGKLKLELAATNYAAGALQVPRGLWGYGIRQNKSVQEKAPAAFDQTALRLGAKGDAALLLAGGTVVSMGTNAVLQAGERTVKLDAPPVHDGLAAAYGRIYISTRDGQLVCVGE